MPAGALYFAYGSNMDVEQMARRCPAARLVGAAVTDGFRFAIDRRWVAALETRVGSQAYGLLWRVTPACLTALDEWEGVARGCYRRAAITCRQWPEAQEEACAVEALTYLSCWEGKPSHRKEGYLERILAAAARAGLPPDYVEAQIAPFERLPTRRRDQAPAL